MNKELIANSYEIIENLSDLNDEFSGKKILITGSAGFLGCQFLHYFYFLNKLKVLKNPCKVYAWDNYIRGLPSWLKKLKDDPFIQIDKKDIVNERVLHRPNYIIHAASIASPIYYRKFPIETIEVNVLGLKNLLDCSIKTKIDSFLFFSTSEIYGDPDEHNIPTSEEYRGYVSCTGPRACYDESKRLGETLCVNYYQQHDIPVKIVRPFNNYGPGLNIDDKRVIPDFFKNVIDNKDITLFSNGSATRTFCYISDAIEGYLRSLLSNHNGQSFNIGTELPEIDMKSLAHEIIKVSGKDLKINYKTNNDKEYTTDNPQRRCPSIKKARELLNYNPKISLNEGLKRTYSYYLLESI